MNKLIAISGPSGSGKSTVCEKLCKKLDAVHVKMDYFYKNKEHHPIYKKWRNQEMLECYKLDEFIQAVSKLKNNEEVEIPVYKRSHGRQMYTETVKPRSIILVDGMLAFIDPRLNKLYDYRIFLDVAQDEQIRRRMHRDPTVTLDYFHEVIIPVFNQYKKIIDRNADIVVDANKSKDKVEKAVVEAVYNFLKR